MNLQFNTTMKFLPIILVVFLIVGMEAKNINQSLECLGLFEMSIAITVSSGSDEMKDLVKNECSLGGIIICGENRESQTALCVCGIYSSRNGPREMKLLGIKVSFS